MFKILDISFVIYISPTIYSMSYKFSTAITSPLCDFGVSNPSIPEPSAMSSDYNLRLRIKMPHVMVYVCMFFLDLV